jgi:predicted alpha/beta hydrolase family esterase
MKRVIIVHCWDGYPDYCWYPYAKSELEKRGFAVEVPTFPETSEPKQKLWVPKLSEIIGRPDENLFLIGHSVGCITILRYLETLEDKEKIGGAVMVAGFTDDLGFDELKNFFETPIDFDKAKQHCPKFIGIFSDNDQYVPLKYSDIYKEKLNAEIIIKHNMGHFSGPVDKEESCTKLPDVVEAIEQISK